MKRLMGGSLILLLSLSQACLADNSECGGQTGGGEVVGTLLGAAIGGLVGSQFGKGTGKSVAIGAGVLAGGFAGNQIGESLDCKDRQYNNSTAQDSLESQPTGTTSSWNNPDSGHQGSITPTRTYQRDDGIYCRDFEQTITVDGKTQQATGTACRQSDGSWQIVNR